LERGTQHHRRSLKGRIICVNKAEMNFAFLSQTRSQHQVEHPINQGDTPPALARCQRDACTLNPRAQHQNAHDVMSIKESRKTNEASLSTRLWGCVYSR
jgi:phage gp29-like protein